MNLTVIGTGYVGLVSGACFAEMGNTVTCVDVDTAKIDKLKQGVIPIYEPGLEAIVKRNVENKTLHFSTNLKESLEKARIAFIAVGTPMGEDGSADLQYVLQVAKEIGEYMQQPLIIVDKSTVPVGTADKVRAEVSKTLKNREKQIDFHV
ncbi:MAG: UDP-glucose 6-dehydrogenase, partial [Muriicola sp.]|nr:UDP-glucose 6-dehydrogenase [Muriicola sp.]